MRIFFLYFINQIYRGKGSMKKTGFFLIVLAFCMTSCSSLKKAATSSTKLSDSLPALPASEIDIPIRIYGPPLLSKAESLAPKEITSDKWPDYVQPTCDFRYKYRFVRSGLNISCLNNTIAVQLTGNYQVTGSRTLCSLNQPVSPWVSGSCGFGKEAMRRVNIGISSSLSFLPSYQLRSTTSISKLQALDKCQVSMFSTNITDLILDSIRSSTLFFCTALDHTIAGLDFSGIFLSSQKLMYQTSLGKYGWLRLQPESIRVGQLNYSNDSFRISVGMRCRPEVSPDSSERPKSYLFPSLEQKENRSGISLYLNVFYDYKFISKIISDTLRNKVFDINGRTIVVKDVVFKGNQQNQIEIRIDFAGTNKGSIYLRGTPTLDTGKQILTVPDVSYSLESKDLVLKMAQSLFRNKIRKSLQGKSYLDIDSLVRNKLTALDEQLNRELTKNVYSTAKTSNIRLIGLLAGPNRLQLQLHLRTELAILSTGSL
jgi:Domain of unknown function (DUF4403)